MALMVEELLKSSQKRGRNNSSSQQQKFLLEAIAKGGTVTSYTAEDGTIRMKILVRKQDLKQILNNNNNTNGGRANANAHDRSSIPSSTSTSSMERRLYDLMKRKRASSGKGMSRLSCSSSTAWRPALHSIPEEH